MNVWIFSILSKLMTPVTIIISAGFTFDKLLDKLNILPSCIFWINCSWTTSPISYFDHVWPCLTLTNMLCGYLWGLACFGPGISTFPQSRPWLETTLCYNDNSFDLVLFLKLHQPGKLCFIRAHPVADDCPWLLWMLWQTDTFTTNTNLYLSPIFLISLHIFDTCLSFGMFKCVFLTTSSAHSG